MTKEDLIDWKRHPVTQEVFSQLKARIEDLKNEMVSSAVDGNVTLNAYRAGVVDAHRDVLNIDFEDTHGN